MLCPYFFQQHLCLRKGGDNSQSDTREPQKGVLGEPNPLCKAGGFRSILLQRLWLSSRQGGNPSCLPVSPGAHGVGDGGGCLQGTGWGRQKGETQQGWRLEGKHTQAEVMERKIFLLEVPEELGVCCKAGDHEK